MISCMTLKFATPDNTEIIGGWTGDQLDKLGGWTDAQLQKLGDAITSGIYNGFVSVMDTIADVILLGSRVGVIFCVIAYIAARDKKSVSFGVKLFLIYLITAFVMSKL